MQTMQENFANARHKKIKVWIVDDVEPFRIVLDASINESEAVECTKCLSNAKELIQSLRKEAAPDVILLDVHMPGMSGVEVIPKIRELAQDTYIVMLTGSSGDETIIGALVAGADGYVLKTRNTDKEAIRAVQEVMADGITMDPEVVRKVIKVLSVGRKSAENYNFTPREEEIFRLIGTGLTEREIAEKPSISFETVRTHYKRIHRKVNSRTHSMLVAKAKDYLS